MKANAVKKQLVEWTDKMAKLREFLAASEQRIKEIDQERAPLLVDAFTGDSEAETKLRKLNAELDSASRDRADANQAIEQASREIARLKAAVQEAATGEKLEAVRSLIRARISDAREQRIVELGRKLKGELNALESSTREIIQALSELGLEHTTTNRVDRERSRIMHCRTFGLDTIFAFDGAAAFTPDALAKLPKVLGKAEEETAGTDAELVAASPKDEHSSKTAPPKRTYGSITEALAAGE